MDINKEREAFEESFKIKWEIGHYILKMVKFIEDSQDYAPVNAVKQMSDEYYWVLALNTGWWAWQAAKAQAVPEWISVKDKLPPNDPYNREYWVYEALNNKVQHDYWVCPDTGLDQDFEPFFNNWSRTVTHWMPMVKYPDPPMKAQEPAND